MTPPPRRARNVTRRPVLAVLLPLAASLKLVKVADTAWSEKTLTFKNAPKLGTVVDTEAPSANSAGVTFDVSSVVRAAGTYSFAVTSSAVNDVARFRASEYSTDRPTLKV